MSDDSELIRRYAREADERAFAAIVQRYVNLVYSAAARMVRDPHLAEDISQTVFLRLARKASELPDSVILAGWLHNDTRLTALQMLRSEKRRAVRESSSMETNDSEADWTKVRPVIDEALAELDPADRDAVLLRFFGDRTFADVGAALKLAPDAARMRVNRALDNLREALGRRGITTTATALSALLLAHSVQSAPNALGRAILTANKGNAIVGGSKSLSTLSGRSVALGLSLVGIALVILVSRGRSTQEERTVAPQNEKLAVASPRQVASTVAVQHSTEAVDTREKTLRLIVLQEGTQNPVPFVTVAVRTFSDLAGSTRSSLTTDANGMVDVVFPTQAKSDFYHQLHLLKDGYVPRYVSWSKFQLDQIENIPAEYKATLPKAITLGGILRSTSGEVIPAASVVFSGPGPLGVDPRERDTTMGDYHTEKTDVNGQWRCSHVRPEFQTLTFRLEHPNYQTATYGCKGTRDPSLVGVVLLPDDDYRNASATMTMVPGLQIAGIVFEKAGAGIPNAVVTLNRAWRKESAIAHTSASGEFILKNGQPGDATVSAQAPGFAPATVDLALTSNIATLRFELSRSIGVSGRVIDEEGNPIRNAEIEFEQNARYQKIYDWRTRTDEFGSFFWDSSPNQPFGVSVFAYGFGRTNLSLTPGNLEQSITLASLPASESVTITGTVADRTTGQALDGGEVFVHVNDYGSSPPVRIAEVRNGKFTFKLENRESSYRLEVRQKGYESAQSGDFKLADTLEPFLFKLNEALELSGIVLLPDGQPAAGAEVALCTLEKRATLGPRKFIFPEESAIVQTDTEGRFHHKRPAGAHHLYAVHEFGYAEARLKHWNGEPLQLKPWARIEGRLTVAGEPRKSETIFVEPAFSHGIEQGLIFYGIAGQTDDSGRFTISDLPPIEVRVSWMRSIGNGKSSTHPLNVQLKPGETAQLDYSINGLTASGKLVWRGERDVNWKQQARGSLLTKRPLKPWEQTPGYAQASAEEKSAIEFEFPYTEAGHEHRRGQRGVAVLIEQDGRFTAPFVEPGDYELWVTVREIFEAGRMPKVLAVTRQDLHIPAGTDTVDLGEIPVSPNQRNQ